MHDEACSTDWREWWPVGEVADVALSSLPAAGATTSPVRLMDVLRVDGTDAPWIGIWGPFFGLRVASSPRNSYPISSGAAIVCPPKDLFLSVETTSGGKVSIARFRSRVAALAWGQANNEIFRVSGAPLGPFPVATAWADGEANPTVSRIGVYSSIWTDRNSLANRMRQPDSYTLRSVQQSAVSMTATGIKATITLAQNALLCTARMTNVTAHSGTITVRLELVRSAVTYGLSSTFSCGSFPTTDSLNLMKDANGLTAPAGSGTPIAYGPIPLITGDVVRINQLTATASGGTDDFEITIREERAAF